MEQKIYKSRIVPKGDIEANWNKALGFIPLDKEIIIYKADAAHPVARFKIGDGVTPVQDLEFSSVDMITMEQFVIQPLESKNNEQDEKIVAIEKKLIIATKDNILSIF